MARQSFAMGRTRVVVVALGAWIVLVGCTGSQQSASSITEAPSLPSSSIERESVIAEPPGGDAPEEDSSDVERASSAAVNSAMNYLRYMAFSRTGLIEQLEYEGFSASDATAAVDSLDVDWMEQAVLKAESYLDSMSFSESGLVEQLKFEGFTRAEAEHGASRAYGSGGGGSAGGGSASQGNAVEAARNYLNYSAFSRSGLISQLEYEGYSRSDATYAADAVGANWDEQAAEAARNYLDLMPMSRSELVSQLKFDGYTASQAAYGVSQAGL